jgi:hypothetical protein
MSDNYGRFFPLAASLTASLSEVGGSICITRWSTWPLGVCIAATKDPALCCLFPCFVQMVAGRKGWIANCRPNADALIARRTGHAPDFPNLMNRRHAKALL